TELFGNLGNGLRNNGNQAVLATGNWWGAGDGPGGDGPGGGTDPGAGDQVVNTSSGSIDASAFLTDGSEFSYFNAGGSNHYGYGIGIPNVSGVSSSEWGAGDSQTFLYEYDAGKLTAEYTGLATGSTYRLLMTYLNQDAGGGSQSLTDINGNGVHESMPLPTASVAYEFVVPKSSVVAGNLSLDLNRVAGVRTVVAGLFLLKEPLVDISAPSVSLDAPVDGAFLPQGVTWVEGTSGDDSDIDRIELGIKAGSQDTLWIPVTDVFGDGSWRYRWNSPADNDYLLQARVTDTAGNQSTTSPVAVIVDNSPPAAATNPFVFSIGGGLRVYWDFSGDDGTGADDVVRYEVFRSQAQFTGFDQVGQKAAGLNQFDDIGVTLGQSYYYFIRTVDHAGNSTDSVTYGPAIPMTSVDSTPPEEVEGFTAVSVYLNSTQASAYMTWTGSANTAGDLVDQRLYISIDGGTNWGNNAPSYNNGQPLSLGRTLRSYQLTGLTVGQTYSLRLTTVDLVPNESAGVTLDVTPQGSPEEYASIGGTLAQDMLLQSGVFRITSNLQVPSGITLTLSPGVIFKFDPGQSLNVSGGLNAAGTALQPIVFTALTDDEYGGDTNGDGPSSGTPGYWYRIRFYDSTDESVSRLDHVVVRYAGSSGSGSIYMYRADVPVTNSLITQSNTDGLYVQDASPLIQGNTITDHLHQGIYNRDGAAQILDNTISGNENGIYARYSTPRVNDNQITDNRNWGVYHYDSQNAPTMMGNTITGNDKGLIVPMSALPDESNVLTPNARRYIGIRGNGLSGDTRLPIWNKGSSDEIHTYRVYTGSITVPQYTTLTIDPGVVIKFVGNLGMTVSGALVAEGTLNEKIVFTSDLDDAIDGDTNGDGNATRPVRGQWWGINFNNSLFEDRTQLKHVMVRYGGASGNGALYIYQADILVENTEISNSSSHGIYVSQASPSLIGNRIWGNGSDGIRVYHSSSNPEVAFNRLSTNLGSGIYLYSSANPSLSVSNNQFVMNRDYGLFNGTGTPVDATNNWWGESDGSGPLHATTNDTATGNQVSNNVVYEPWSDEEALVYAYTDYGETISGFGSLAQPTLIQGTGSVEWGTDPDRSMVADADAVILDYTGLDTGKRYKVRVSYLNGDAAAVWQSLTDGAGNPIHDSMLMPTVPVQYEFKIPPALYPTGEIRLQFVHDNVDTSLRGALTELWLFEDKEEIAPPRFEAVEYNDVDGSGTLSIGDEYHFHFSEALDTGLIIDGTTDANTVLIPEGGGIYGTLNQVHWSADEQTVVVTLTEGFSVTGTELVTPVELTATNGNAAIGSRSLTLDDSLAPSFIGLMWNDNDGSGQLSLGDSYEFRFDEAMDTAVIADGGTGANAHLRPQGGTRYGNTNGVVWSADGRLVVVEVTDGYTIVGDEQVVPSSFVTDIAGNQVTGTQHLTGKDVTPPQLTAVRFDDADGSGTPTVGDRWFFDFSEPLRPLALSDNTTEGNLNLSPAGRKYGTINSIAWNSDLTSVSIGVTTGFTVTGSELVDPSDLLTDRSGNPVSNTLALNLIDVIGPEVTRVQANYISPVSGTDSYRLTVQFNSRMDTSVEPVVTLESSGAADPIVPSGGNWLTTRYNNDTYVTPDILLDSTMDGILSATVSGADDWAGNAMAVPADNIFNIELDATPPSNPLLSIPAIGCHSASLAWTGYVDPGDVTGFQIYRSTEGEFTTVDGTSFVNLVDGASRAFELSGLVVDVQYHVAVVAMDEVGNITRDVTSQGIFIDQATPAPVGIAVTPGIEPDSTVIDWSGYDTSDLCGFAGFRVYVEEVNFSEVSGLTAVTTLGVDERSYSLSGLDRSKTYYFAVVGFNGADEFNTVVTTASWSDPYAGDISVDTTIGSGEQTEIDIAATMRIRNGATLTIEPGTTLRFAPGTGIETMDGRIVALGTPLSPILLTSANDVIGGAPAPGDWEGMTLGPDDTGSELEHLSIRYAGLGLWIDGATAAVAGALTVEHDAGPGIQVSNAGVLDTSAALLQFNAVGAQVDTGGSLTVSDSVLKNNSSDGGVSITNAVSDGQTDMVARNNWWGALDAGSIAGTVTNHVDTADFLISEPVLTPAIGTANGETDVIIPRVDLVLAGRLAEEMRLSEVSSFEGVFYEPFSPFKSFELTPSGGQKSIYAQFRSATGHESIPVFIDITYLTDGPEIEIFNLAEGQVVNRPVQVEGQVFASQGLAAQEFYVDGQLVTSVGSPNLSFRWDVRDLSNGIHRVKLLARDVNGNLATSEKNLIIEVLPPPAPVITSPLDGLSLSGGTVSVVGAAEPLVPVRIYRNNFVKGSLVASADGSFVLPDVSLVEGTNEIHAVAEDGVGSSSASNRVGITLDTGAPAAVELIDVSAQAGVGVNLLWQFAPVGEQAVSFRVYRHTAAFQDVAQATLVGDGLDQLDFSDTSVSDGIYFYGVIGLDGAGNPSPLSNLETVTYDGTRPSFSVTFDAPMPVGTGGLGIMLNSSEPLTGTPSLIITAAGSSSPMAIALTQVDEVGYQGTLDVLQETPSGIARVSVSGSDLAGNSFSGDLGSPALMLDTRGPSGQLAFTSTPPIQVQSEVSVSLTLTLDEAAGPGQIPTLNFDPPEGDSVTVAMLGSGITWNGVLIMRPEMGSGFGRFDFSVRDALGNQGTLLTAGEELEVYNTATPEPTEAPTGLAMTSHPEGIVRLNWNEVEKAETYRLYRDSGSCVAAPTQLLATDLTALQFEDTPGVDGNYCYAVTAERRGAESPQSDNVEGLSDRQPPEAPTQVTAALGQRGVEVTWVASTGPETPSGYRVYRDGALIRSVSDSVTMINDYPSTGGTYRYRVAAVDAVGNESLSEEAEFALLVGAVRALMVTVDQDSLPLLTWENSDHNAVGFNVYRGGSRVNGALVTSNSFEDIYYTRSGKVEYGVRAVDSQGRESPSRTLVVYPIALSVVANPDTDSQLLLARYLNQLQISVDNEAAVDPFIFSRIELEASVNGVEIFDSSSGSEQSVAAGSNYIGDFVLPLSSLSQDHLVKITLTQQPQPGGSVVYRYAAVIGAEQPGIMVRLTIDDVPLAGGFATIHLCAANLGYLPMDLITSRKNGADPGDIYVAIRNAEGLEISRGAFTGFPAGTQISGTTGYVRVDPGSELCVDVPVLVPASLEEGDILSFIGVVDQYSYDLTGINTPSLVNLEGAMQSGITFSEYYGTAQADQNIYTDGDTVVISGQAIDRESGQVRADTPLKIGFSVRGFKWYQEVVTDAAGEYRYEFNPSPGVSGEFIIWAAHPDVYDILDQDRFRLYRFYSIPSRGEIRSAKADTLTYRISLFNPGDLPLTGFSMVFRAYTVDDQNQEIDEPLLSGETLFPEGFVLGPNEKREVEMTLFAAIDAPDSVNVEYQFQAAEGPTSVFYASVELAPAIPLVVVESPSVGYVDVSVDRGSLVTVPVTIKNLGLRELQDAVMALPQTETWITTNLPLDANGKVSFGTIDVGEEITFDVLISPPADADFGVKVDKFVLTGSNSPQEFDIRIFPLITSDLTGSVLFKVINILGQPLENATVRMRNTLIHEDITPVKTDVNGEVTVPDLQEGDWSYQVSAAGHSTDAGGVSVIADQTVIEEVFPTRALVTVNFSVEPVPYTDRYEIKIEQTFETHVPLPVLVVDPTYLKFENVQPGFNAEFVAKASNKGLIKIEDLRISTGEAPWGKLEPMISYVPELKPGETIDVPYRFTYTGDGIVLPGDAAGWADCFTGGFASLAQAMVGLNSAFRGRSFCFYTREEAQNLLNIANGLMIGIHLFNAVNSLNSLTGAIGQALSCLAQQFIGPGGPGGSGPGPSTGPSSGLRGIPVCFTAGTPVTMADGTRRPIEAIATGDLVMSKEGRPTPVTRTYRRETDHIRELHYQVVGSGEMRRLETTDEHQFHIEGGDWKAAHRLVTGDRIVLQGSETAVVQFTQRFERNAVVYNFDVADHEAYFANGALVHQRCGGEVSAIDRLESLLDEAARERNLWGPSQPPPDILAELKRLDMPQGAAEKTGVTP
ncbi:MAG: DUF1565 domain-containing protein, partial [Gammaproteobacteria bacterium]|nr:DUF1565 domain-containing protein [Gammaproteobacteria bacterium]